MLILIVHMLFELSILFCLNDLEKLIVYMLILSFEYCWNYALIIVNYTGIIYEWLLKPHYLQ